jgi:DNA polymerase I-like protein with 3'-5' exonuclease and polymerase domains
VETVSCCRAGANNQVRTKIGRIILIPDNVTDTSLFRLPVQANGADGFKLALCRISGGLKGMDARIVHTLHDEIIVEARDGIEDQVKEIVMDSMEEAFKQIILRVRFVAEITVAQTWG